MSGGVDSTSCALLLQKEYEVHGFFMELAQPDIEDQKSRVRETAKRLGIPLTVINLQNDFQQRVLNYFTSSYDSGLTPNPCMVCNREIKFGLFMDAILSRGVDMIATGHYVRLKKGEESYHLYSGIDPKKDQSYFLARLTQEQLSRVLFPLGEQTKEQTYSFMEDQDFGFPREQESQDVCFYETNRIGNYLESVLPDKDRQGDIVTLDGRTVGSHNGLFRYTIGQRRGLGISDTTPWYVVRLNGKTNQVVVGKSEDLLNDTITISQPNWISGFEPNFSRTYSVRIRYSHRGSPATIEKIEENRFRISFEEPQRAITPGQFAVIYLGDEVIGSGVIL